MIENKEDLPIELGRAIILIAIFLILAMMAFTQWKIYVLGFGAAGLAIYFAYRTFMDAGKVMKK